MNTKTNKHICPHCGCNTEDVDYSIHKDSLIGYHTCPHCRYKWEEYYSLLYNGYDDGFYEYDAAGNRLCDSELDHYTINNTMIEAGV